MMTTAVGGLAARLRQPLPPALPGQVSATGCGVSAGANQWR